MQNCPFLPAFVSTYCMSLHFQFSSVDLEQSLFQPFPSEVVFQNYAPCEIYEVPLILRNNDKVSAITWTFNSLWCCLISVGCALRWSACYQLSVGAQCTVRCSDSYVYKVTVTYQLNLYTYMLDASLCSTHIFLHSKILICSCKWFLHPYPGCLDVYLLHWQAGMPIDI